MTCRTTNIFALHACPSKTATAILTKTIPCLSLIKSHATKNPFPAGVLANHHSLCKRHRSIRNVNVSSSLYSSTSRAEELPLLPFPVDQVLVPTESKTLHLYEARYLALLDESLFGRKKHFVHFVLDPIGISDTAEASFAARYGCLVLIEKVERLDVGALVSIRGIGRVTIVNFIQADPYLKGIVRPMQDVVPECASKLNSQVMELKQALLCLNSLETKLKIQVVIDKLESQVSGEFKMKDLNATKRIMEMEIDRRRKMEGTQGGTQITNSVNWAEKKSSLDNYGAFLPQFAERLSFAALQPVSGLTRTESLKLQKQKLNAMSVKDTLERLSQSLEFVQENISMVAAKLAIQSLEAQ